MSKLYQQVKSNYEPGVAVDKSFMRKTAELVQSTTTAGEIRETGKTMVLTTEALEALAGGDKPDTVKVFNLVKSLKERADDMGGEQPYLIPIGERAMRVLEAYEKRQTSTQEALLELEKLIADTRAAEAQEHSSGLSPYALAVRMLLASDSVPGADSISTALDQAMTEFPHWKDSEDQQRHLRGSLYRILIDAGVKADMVPLATRIMGLLSVLTRHA